MEEQIKESPVMCPNCGSTALSANKKGFNGNKAAIGMSLVGVSGLTMGMKGMDEIEITCLKCGTTFKPGEGATSVEELEKKKRDLQDRKDAETSNKTIRYVIAAILIIGTCIWLYSQFSFLF